MSQVQHYDVIIIGTGAGGGTLASTLAPSGKRILMLERGDYVPREKDNWSPCRECRGEVQHQRGVARQRRPAAASVATPATASHAWSMPNLMPRCAV